MEQPLWILSGQQHAFIYVPIVACGLLDIAVTITEGIEDLHRNTDVVTMQWVFFINEKRNSLVPTLYHGRPRGTRLHTPLKFN